MFPQIHGSAEMFLRLCGDGDYRQRAVGAGAALHLRWFLIKQLSRQGKSESPVKKVLSLCKSPSVSHGLSPPQEAGVCDLQPRDLHSAGGCLWLPAVGHAACPCWNVCLWGRRHLVRACPNRTGSNGGFYMFVLLALLCQKTRSFCCYPETVHFYSECERLTGFLTLLAHIFKSI